MSPAECLKIAPTAVRLILSAVDPSKLSLLSKESKSKGPPLQKSPSHDSTLRWIFFGIFLGVTVPFLFALIVMIAESD